MAIELTETEFHELQFTVNQAAQTIDKLVQRAEDQGNELAAITGRLEDTRRLNQYLQRRLDDTRSDVSELRTDLATIHEVLDFGNNVEEVRAALDNLVKDTDDGISARGVTPPTDEPRTIRRRIHASTSVKGIKKLEHTVECNGYSLVDQLTEWDAQDAAVEARQPTSPGWRDCVPKDEEPINILPF
jgi:hypothetical protein